MGIFSNFKNYRDSRSQRKVEKNLKIVGNRKAIKEDRAAALEYFKDHPDPAVAVPALLQRFNYSLEHGINDTREKESARDGITRHKEKALEYVQKHLQESMHIAWPIKIINELAKPEEVVEILKSALNYGDISFSQEAVDKNYDILCYLAEYKMPGFYKQLAHFLKDPDERVRFSCVEVLINQDDDEIKGLLEPFLSDDSAENRRIRNSVIDAFVNKNWQITDASKFEAGLLTEGVFVTKKGKIERRG